MYTEYKTFEKGVLPLQSSDSCHHHPLPSIGLDTIVQLGRININSLSGLKKLGVAQSGHTSWTRPSLLDLEEGSDGMYSVLLYLFHIQFRALLCITLNHAAAYKTGVHFQCHLALSPYSTGCLLYFIRGASLGVRLLLVCVVVYSVIPYHLHFMVCTCTSSLVPRLSIFFLGFVHSDTISLAVV